MKKIRPMLLTVCLALFLCMPTSFASTFREVKQTTTSVQLKMTASPQAQTIGTFAAKTLLTQLPPIQNGWARVQTGQTIGYVPASTLITPPSTIKIATSKSGLVVKQWASKQSNTVATLRYNMIVEDYGPVGGGWSFIQYGNVTGYVNSAFIGQPVTSTKQVTGTGNYTVRNIASTSGVSKGTVKGGTTVTVHAEVAGWSYISSNMLRGYMPSAQLQAKKATPAAAAPQTLTTFTHLRPSAVLSMTYYNATESDYSQDVFTSRLYSETNGHTYSYWTDHEVVGYYALGGIYHSYSPKRFMLGKANTDWIWADIQIPTTRNKPTPIMEPAYDFDNMNAPDIHVGNAYLRATNATVTTRAGTFTNAVHIEMKYYNSSHSRHLYFVPTLGLVKMMRDQEVLLEIISYVKR